jgi:hypothetical protein
VQTLRKTFFQLLRSALRRKHVFLVANGFLFASIFYFYNEDRYEKKLFLALAQHVTAKADPVSKDSLILESLHLTHELGEQRVNTFGNARNYDFKSVLHPLTVDLMTADGSCGSYSMILSRILTELNIDNRIVQMKVDGAYGGHIIVEVESDHDGWVVLDPSYNLSFKKPDGRFAKFSDVSNNWQSYSKQVPQSYNMDYRYEGLRYTNWTKIPVLMPAVKSVLTWTIGKEKTDTLSIRTMFLRKFHIMFLATIFLHLILLSIVFVKYLRRNRPAAKSEVARQRFIGREPVTKGHAVAS